MEGFKEFLLLEIFGLFKKEDPKNTSIINNVKQLIEKATSGDRESQYQIKDMLDSLSQGAPTHLGWSKQLTNEIINLLKSYKPGMRNVKTDVPQDTKITKPGLNPIIAEMQTNESTARRLFVDLHKDIFLREKGLFEDKENIQKQAIEIMYKKYGYQPFFPHNYNDKPDGWIQIPQGSWLMSGKVTRIIRPGLEKNGKLEIPAFVEVE